MLMPTVFHENLFDDFFDPFWNDAALERMMNREARDTFGKRGANMMKTDVKQTDNGYEVAVDLPGCKREDAVSYTHLDVYKRQLLELLTMVAPSALAAIPVRTAVCHFPRRASRASIR